MGDVWIIGTIVFLSIGLIFAGNSYRHLIRAQQATNRSIEAHNEAIRNINRTIRLMAGLDPEEKEEIHD